jgi:hypothetical protein
MAEELKHEARELSLEEAFQQFCIKRFGQPHPPKAPAHSLLVEHETKILPIANVHAEHKVKAQRANDEHNSRYGRMDSNLHKVIEMLGEERKFWENSSVSTSRKITQFMTSLTTMREYIEEKNVAAFIVAFRDNVWAVSIRECFRNHAANHSVKLLRDEAVRSLIRVCDRMLELLHKDTRNEWARKKQFSAEEAERVFLNKKAELEPEALRPLEDKEDRALAMDAHDLDFA